MASIISPPDPLFVVTSTPAKGGHATRLDLIGAKGGGRVVDLAGLTGQDEQSSSEDEDESSEDEDDLGEQGTARDPERKRRDWRPWRRRPSSGAGAAAVGDVKHSKFISSRLPPLLGSVRMASEDKVASTVIYEYAPGKNGRGYAPMRRVEYNGRLAQGETPPPLKSVINLDRHGIPRHGTVYFPLPVPVRTKFMERRRSILLDDDFAVAVSTTYFFVPTSLPSPDPKAASGGMPPNVDPVITGGGGRPTRQDPPPTLGLLKVVYRGLLVGDDGEVDQGGDLVVEYMSPSSTVVRRVFWRNAPSSFGTTNWFVTVWDYAHARHPVLRTYELASSGVRMATTPALVENDYYQIITKNKPKESWWSDHPLALPYLLDGRIKDAGLRVPATGAKPKAPETPKRFKWLRKLFSRRKKFELNVGRIPTPEARLALWTFWSSGNLEAAYARQVDEDILRGEPLLKQYWKLRDSGNVDEAAAYIVRNEAQITMVIGFAVPASARTHFVFRTADLFSCLDGGQSHMLEIGMEGGGVRKRGLDVDIDGDEEVGGHRNLGDHIFFDDGEPLQIMALDSGTWPSDGGGVASCRRDVVDRLPYCRWFMVSEVGHPMKLIHAHYQCEVNVAYLTFVHLWGCEIGGPNQTILSEVPYGVLGSRADATTDHVVKRIFVPIIKSLVTLCVETRSELSNEEALNGIANIFANLHTYFRNFDWSATWENGATIEAWRGTWISFEERELKRGNRVPCECPTLDEIDFAMSLFIHFLLPITVPLPKGVEVIHASHHGTQAALGAAYRKLFDVGFLVWDHGILWRERLVALSELNIFAPFVRNALTDLVRLTTRAVMVTADAMAPCARTRNPEWEVHAGGGQSATAQAKMWRKVSPVVNGMETDRFTPTYSTEEARPSAVMLSHVYELKSVHTAIRAADVIVNKIGVKEYQLIVYGSLDKDLGYVAMCRAMITNLGLSDNVYLEGLGAAPKVLPRGWLFLNSSISEGLPLALGEAGLAGMPVVCTDVGGSRDVVTDPSGFIYGRVVAARDPYGLGTAQLEVIGCFGTLETVGSPNGDPSLGPKGLEPGSLPETFAEYMKTHTLDDLRERFKQMTDYRRRLGLRYRAFVLMNFSMDRYLREHHHQMWVGVARRRARLRARVREEHRLLQNGAEAGTVMRGRTNVEADAEPRQTPAPRRAPRQVSATESDVTVSDAIDSGYSDAEDQVAALRSRISVLPPVISRRRGMPVAPPVKKINDDRDAPAPLPSITRQQSMLFSTNMAREPTPLTSRRAMDISAIPSLVKDLDFFASPAPRRAAEAGRERNAPARRNDRRAVLGAADALVAAQALNARPSSGGRRAKLEPVDDTVAERLKDIEQRKRMRLRRQLSNQLSSSGSQLGDEIEAYRKTMKEAPTVEQTTPVAAARPPRKSNESPTPEIDPSMLLSVRGGALAAIAESSSSASETEGAFDRRAHRKAAERAAKAAAKQAKRDAKQAKRDAKKAKRKSRAAKSKLKRSKSTMDREAADNALIHGTAESDDDDDDDDNDEISPMPSLVGRNRRRSKRRQRSDDLARPIGNHRMDEDDPPLLGTAMMGTSQGAGIAMFPAEVRQYILKRRQQGLQ